MRKRKFMQDYSRNQYWRDLGGYFQRSRWARKTNKACNFSLPQGREGRYFSMGGFATKSELIRNSRAQTRRCSPKDVEQAVKTMLEQMSESLAGGERIEIRGFGSFRCIFAPTDRPQPKTGDAVTLTGNMPHLKTG